ncbi:hypothetical protein [Kitasatospora sp. NPDC057198]|uniref:hypothetical protein n=1 Tax=Kitasatospora sp. NPDC057198 TaxID=3346046 RepID=UPI0036306CF8
MTSTGEFFLAPDDGSADRVRPRRSHGFPAVPCDGIHPDDSADLLVRVSALAAARTGQLALYCWYFSP